MAGSLQPAALFSVRLAVQLAAQGLVLPQPGLLETGQAQQSAADAAAPQVILDWKGDPMTINPNDNMPFF